MAERTYARCVETDEIMNVGYSIVEAIRDNAEDFSEICVVHGNELVCETSAQFERLKALDKSKKNRIAVQLAAESTLGAWAVEEAFAEFENAPVLSVDDLIANRLLARMEKEGRTVNEIDVVAMKKRAARELVSDLHKAFLAGSLKQAVDNVAVPTDLLTRFGSRAAINYMINEAISTAHIMSFSQSDRTECRHADEKAFVAWLDEELTARARQILIDDFDEAVRFAKSRENSEK